MRIALATLLTVLPGLMVPVALSGCDAEKYIVKDELGDAVQRGERVLEMRGQVTAADLVRNADGSGQLTFLFVYLLGIVDPEGIAGIDWEYALYHPDRTELAAGGDEMRGPELDKQYTLVHSQLPGRSRTLVIPPGSLEAGQVYVVRLILWYRAEILFEVLVPVEPGVPYLDPVDPEELPDLLNGF